MRCENWSQDRWKAYFDYEDEYISMTIHEMCFDYTDAEIQSMTRDAEEYEKFCQQFLSNVCINC